jgi:quercetin dioxygenase-like cupin family protein
MLTPADQPPERKEEHLMEMLTKPPTTKGPDTMFTGDVWFDVIVRGEPPSRVRTNTVRFSPGARTAWHSHAVGQTLYVTEGIGLVQAPRRQPAPCGVDHERPLDSAR